MTAVLPIEVVDKLKQYEQLMIDKRGLERDIEILKEAIVPELPVGKTIETEIGTFTVQSRLKWTHSKYVKELKTHLKEIEDAEKQDGTATSEPGEPFLVYTEKK